MENDLDAYIQSGGDITSDEPYFDESSSDETHNVYPPADGGLDDGLTSQPDYAPEPQISPDVVNKLLQDNVRMREALVFQAQQDAVRQEQEFFARLETLEPEDRAQAQYYYETAKAQQQIQALQTQLQEYQGKQVRVQEAQAKVEAARIIASRAGLQEEQAPLLLAAGTPQAMEALAMGLAQYAPRQVNRNPYLATGDQPSGPPTPQIRKRSGDLSGLISSRTYR